MQQIHILLLETPWNFLFPNIYPSLGELSDVEPTGAGASHNVHTA